MSARDVGAEWDQRYREHGWSTTPDPALSDVVANLHPGRALDLGCGTGRNALFLARLGWRVTGVDASEVGLASARDLAAAEGLDFTAVRADLGTFEAPEGGFELVVMANIHLDPEEHDVVWPRAARAVAPGGHLFVTGHHRRSLGVAGPPDPRRLFDEEMFRDAFVGLTTELLEVRATPSDAGHGDDVNLVFWARRPQDTSGSAR